MRTSMGVAKDGTVIYYLKKNMVYNLRGTKYSMPKTKGGKKTVDLIYREDQKEFIVGMKRKGVKKGGSILDPDLVVEGRRGAVLGPVIGYGRTNPNEKYKH
jgi:RNA-binding protein NOB1